MKKIHVGLSVVVFITVVFIGLHFWKKTDERPDVHRLIPSEFKLNETQKQSLIPVDEALLVSVSRWKDSHGLYQVQVGKTEGAVQKDSFRLGRLHLRPLGEEVARPVYLCEMSVGSSEEGRKQRILDARENCSGLGKPVDGKPIGYLSEKIRTGYLLLFQCRSPHTGYYLTLNSKCEDKEDRIVSSVGAIRADQH